MSKHLLLFVRLALLIGLIAIAAMGQTKHITAFTGTWRLNLAKSEFTPGPPFKSLILTFTPDGTRNLDLIGANGQLLKASLPWSDGKEVAVATPVGMGKVTATSKIQGRSFRDTWKENGRVIEQVHGVLSSDGRTLTVTVDGTPSQGSAFHNRLKFEKQ